MMGAFTLIMEHRRPVAALLPERLPVAQLRTLHALLADRATIDPELAERWECALVLADPDWAQAQKKRQPMLKPKDPETVCLLKFL